MIEYARVQQLPKVKPRNAQEDDNKEEAAAVEQSVPADETQQICALSGERFETFWDDGLQQWRYRDAVLLDAEAATRSALSRFRQMIFCIFVSAEPTCTCRASVLCSWHWHLNLYSLKTV